MQMPKEWYHNTKEWLDLVKANFSAEKIFHLMNRVVNKLMSQQISDGPTPV